MLTFYKYHGLGNDFLILDKKEVKHQDIYRLTKKLCDRHFGIGADGILLSDGLSMEIYNADGSYAQMCGNGIRCYVKYCYDEGICRDISYDLTCGKQKIPIQILSLDPFMVNVNMGIPLYDADAIGVRKDLYRLPYPFLMKDGTVLKGYSFFMTNTHTVIFVDRLQEDNIMDWGEQICHHPLFQDGTNVDFVQIINTSTLAVRTYERGVGLSLSCGSGACAAFAASHRFKNTSSMMNILFLKGELGVFLEEEHIHMVGSASRIAKGVYDGI